jgi:hypothetical protein
MLGILAGAYGCAFAFAPVLQIRTMLMRGGAEQVSLALFVASLGNGSLWLAYGASVGSLPITLSNILGLSTTTATVLVMRRLRAGARSAREEDVKKRATGLEPATLSLGS